MSLVERETTAGVTVLRMNHPRKLNGWTGPMLEALQAALADAGADRTTRGIVLTGTDPYYSAGVNLAGALRPMHPATLHGWIASHNEALFESFLALDKPILAAVNGPAIGATVTSATLCDGILASDRATFSTPFARLGVTPEGCSSVLFPALMGEHTANRMLGPEGFVPTGEEAVDIGLATAVVAHDQLLETAIATVRAWIDADRPRTFRGGMTREDLRAVNARESRALADAFLSRPFLQGQLDFLRAKGRRRPAALFWLLLRTHPLWSRLIHAKDPAE
jgi:enoyl-CoA hydratase/carnithine racemase